MQADNQAVSKRSVTEKASEVLRELGPNTAAENGGWVRSFHIEYDSDVEGWCAHLIWEVPSLPVPEIDETENLDAPDLLFDLCSLGGEKLGNLVAITNCEYVTAEEYETRYSSPNWQSVLTELENDSQR